MGYIEEWQKLRSDEKAFVLRVMNGGGGKYAAGPHNSDDGEVALWQKPEELLFIEAVGSYKFLVTDNFYQLLEFALGIEAEDLKYMKKD